MIYKELFEIPDLPAIALSYVYTHPFTVLNSKGEPEAPFTPEIVQAVWDPLIKAIPPSEPDSIFGNGLKPRTTFLRRINKNPPHSIRTTTCGFRALGQLLAYVPLPAWQNYPKLIKTNPFSPEIDRLASSIKRERDAILIQFFNRLPDHPGNTAISDFRNTLEGNPDFEQTQAIRIWMKGHVNDLQHIKNLNFLEASWEKDSLIFVDPDRNYFVPREVCYLQGLSATEMGKVLQSAAKLGHTDTVKAVLADRRSSQISAPALTSSLQYATDKSQFSSLRALLDKIRAMYKEPSNIGAEFRKCNIGAGLNFAVGNKDLRSLRLFIQSGLLEKISAENANLRLKYLPTDLTNLTDLENDFQVREFILNKMFEGAAFTGSLQCIFALFHALKSLGVRFNWDKVQENARLGAFGPLGHKDINQTVALTKMLFEEDARGSFDRLNANSWGQLFLDAATNGDLSQLQMITMAPQFPFVPDCYVFKALQAATVGNNSTCLRKILRFHERLYESDLLSIIETVIKKGDVASLQVFLDQKDLPIRVIGQAFLAATGEGFRFFTNKESPSLECLCALIRSSRFKEISDQDVAEGIYKMMNYPSLLPELIKEMQHLPEFKDVNIMEWAQKVLAERDSNLN